MQRDVDVAGLVRVIPLEDSLIGVLVRVIPLEDSD